MKYVPALAALLAATSCHADYMVMSVDSMPNPLGDNTDDTIVVEDTAVPDTGEGDCDDVTPVELFISPDDSNSMSSPVQIRRSILDGRYPQATVRTYEFMNYYSFDYLAPAEGLALDAQMTRLEGSEDRFALQVAVTAPERSNAEREPMNVTLVLDESGSMSGEPIDLLRMSSRSIAHSLRPGDVVSVVTWDTSNNVRLRGHTVRSSDDPDLLDAIAGITSGGGTDLSAGLKKGYELAQEHYADDRINRVVLISDGGANAGITDVGVISGAAGVIDVDEGIYLVGVGVGAAQSYNDELMDSVTDAGRGAAVFIPNHEEATRVLEDRFVNTMDVAARSVQIRLDLPPGFEVEKFSGEEFSVDPEEIEPQHLAPNDSMVFYQTLWTCAPELVSDQTRIAVHVTWTDPVQMAPHSSSEMWTLQELVEGDHALLEKGSAVYHYADAIKTWQMTDSRYKRGAILDRYLSEVLLVAEASNPGDADLAEIHRVIEALQAM